MFTAYCPRHGSRVLLSERRIVAVHNTPDGIVVEAQCHDGARIFSVTGRQVAEDAPDRVLRARRAVATVRQRRPVELGAAG
jgi:hypothetical protein